MVQRCGCLGDCAGVGRGMGGWSRNVGYAVEGDGMERRVTGGGEPIEKLVEGGERGEERNYGGKLK